MHNGLDDKRRRRINLRDRRVEEVLPEHFAADYPKFISLLESYYEFENENNPTELLDHLFETRDISQTDLDLLSFIEDELLLGEAYFEGFPDKRAAAQFSSILFRAKGSKYSIEWFFRAFFGEDAEVLYPKSDIFNIGQSEIGPDSLKFITDDKLYQTFALLIRSGRPLNEWKDIYKLFVHPAGMYLGAETVINLAGETGFEADSVEPTQRLTPAYSLTGGSGSEGTTASVTISGTNSLDTNLRYYIEHLSTSPEDFVTPPPTSLNAAGDLVVLSNAASVDFSYATDTPVIPTEGTEVFAFKLYDYEGRLLDSANIDIFDVLPTYTVTVDTTNVTEGGSITGNVASDIPANEVITLAITGAASGDARISAPGTVTMSSSPQPFTITTSVDALPNGSVSGSVQASSAFDVASDAFSLVDAAAVYELRVDNTSLAENSGGSFSFDIGPGASNIPNGTYNFWLIAPADGTSAVFTGGSRDLSFNGGDAPTSGSRLAVTITDNQISNVTGLGAVTSIPITVVDDLVSTGNLEFRGVIGTTGGSALDTTADLTITDNDVITYDLQLWDNLLRTGPQATSFVESDAIYGRVVVSASGPSETVTVRFQANSDVRLTSASAPSNNITTFTNTGAGNYDFTYVIPNSDVYQGPTAVTVEATSTEASDTQAITVTDVIETYAIQGSDPLTVSEVAGAQTITVNTTNVADSTVLYWNITTDAPGTTQASTDWAAYNSGGTGFTINSNTGSFTIDALADATTESAETYYLHVRTVSDAGTSVDSIQLDVTDDSQTAFTVSSVTGVASIDDISGLPTIDQEMTEVISVSDNSPFESTASFSLVADGTVAYNNLNQTSGSGSNQQSATIITPSSAQGTWSNPGGLGQYSGPADNWTSQTSASPGIGQFYQINIRAYDVGTTNTLSNTLGKAIVAGGGSYDFTALGDNNASTWFRMNTGVTFTCFEDTFTPAGTYNNEMDVEITIKEYDGTLGTGTTAFGPQTFTIRARNVV